jgi:hypothetical protein
MLRRFIWPKKVKAIKRSTIRQRTQVGLVFETVTSCKFEAFMKNCEWIS